MDYKTNYQAYKNKRDEELRDSWRAARQSGDYSGRNLNFLIQALRQLRITPAKLAEKSECTPQMINWWFVSDDCRLSLLKEILKKIDIELSCSLQELPDSPFLNCKPQVGKIISGGAQNAVITLRIDEELVDLSGLKTPKQTVMDLLDESSNMWFLAEFIKSHGLSIYSFSRMVGLEYPTLYGFFTRDDIRISRLMEIARGGKLQVDFSFRRVGKENADGTEESESR